MPENDTGRTNKSKRHKFKQHRSVAESREGDRPDLTDEQVADEVVMLTMPGRKLSEAEQLRLAQYELRLTATTRVTCEECRRPFADKRDGRDRYCPECKPAMMALGVPLLELYTKRTGT